MRANSLAKYALVVTLALVASFFVPNYSQDAAEAAVANDFQPGYIISDENFFASRSLTESEIQTFLNSKANPCSAGYVCLKDYTQRTTTIAADSYCNGFSGQASESAASIIAKTAVSCGISPKVLIVLLQKEQGLVTRSDPAQWRYNASTGMGCPDTAACDPTLAGFFYQVFYAARSFKKYVLLNSGFRYHWGQYNNIQYNPNAACGTQSVFIRNQATAALYIYTPYVPSAAALADLYGTGTDPNCSAYGNRNFWRYYSDWFGNPIGNTPVANLDAYEISPGKIRIRGWALDMDTSEPIQIHAYFNNVGSVVLANVPRPDLATNLPAQYRGVGSTHGFDAEIAVPVSGPLQICLYAINVGSGENNRFDCRNTTSLSGNPLGSLDSLTAQGNNISVSGWALDPDTSAPISLHVYANGRMLGELSASNSRQDLTQYFPVQGNVHGFTGNLSAPSGQQNVCVYGINTGRGDNTLIGCKSVEILGGSPVGVIDYISQAPGSFTVAGWAFEPGYSGATPIHVYVNGRGVAGANGVSRPDVQRVMNGAPATAGYSVQIPANPGPNTVCAYAIDQVGNDAHKLIGCKVVTGLAGSPFGAVDSVTANATSVSASGWVIDPDTSGNVGIHMYLDGALVTMGETTITRPDVARIYPLYQANRGYTLSATNLQLASGAHQLCLYGINSGAGDNALLRCQPVFVP